MILHVNDISNVGKAIVNGLRKNGIDAELIYLQKLKGLAWRDKVRTLIGEIMCIRDKAKKAKVVHIHYGFYGILGVIGSFPYILHCHGSDLNLNLKDPVLGPLTRLAIRKAKKVIYSTPDLMAKIILLRADAIFLPNPVDTKFFKPFSREKLNEIKILSISRLNKVKGIDTVFEAFKELKKVHPEIGIYSMGTGLEADHWRSSPYVDGFFENIEHDKMPEFINQFDIIIGQMASGAMGVSELEAMACGKPVIVNFKYRGVYGKEPPVLYAETSQDIVKWLLKLRDNRPAISSLGQAARQWIILFHDTQRVITKLKSIYEINER